MQTEDVMCLCTCVCIYIYIYILYCFYYTYIHTYLYTHAQICIYRYQGHLHALEKEVMQRKEELEKEDVYTEKALLLEKVKTIEFK